ncbi:MAG TPA: M48 family metallopeptidase [Candidatus Acidoferrales bacterium]|nr:M48 family metallopeptidase [Candidatus Acidoferrales bacterium]
MKNQLIGRILFLSIISALVMASSGCDTVPVTGRKQFNLMSPGQEQQLGLTSFQQLKKDTPISKDPAANALVQKVGHRIAAVADKDMPGAQWEFVVFESKEANAFCLPGGKVGVYTGILPITKDEAGLATVIGHEVGHAVARHGGERMTDAMAVQGLGEFLDASLSQGDPRVQAAAVASYGLASPLIVTLPFSRLQESEADHIGLIYMARAGYDPRSAVAFWQRFADYNKQQGGSTPVFLRTHPTDAKRIQQLEAWMPDALAQYHPAQ